MTVQDPYPTTLDDMPFAPPDVPPAAQQTPEVKALNRIAVALEQLVLTMMDKPTQPAQSGLTALPPVRPVPTASYACPIHNVPWKTIPAGVSKKTGNPYTAFQACSVQGCDQRPAA